MEEIISRFFENIGLRISGPMKFRFILQPLMAVIFTIIAGVKDAKKGKDPYGKAVLTNAGDRKALLKEMWKDVGKVFILAVVLDIVYQLILIYGLKTQTAFYPLESLIVAFILAIVPYFILRGPVNRIVRMFLKKDSK